MSCVTYLMKYHNSSTSTFWKVSILEPFSRPRLNCSHVQQFQDLVGQSRNLCTAYVQLPHSNVLELLQKMEFDQVTFPIF